GMEATDLDTGTHTLTLGGFEPLHYDKLLIATGSRPRQLDIPGADLSGVRYLRTIFDSDTLVEHLQPGLRVVIVGAGWIGLETAAAAVNRGASALVVEMDTLPLRRVLGDEVAEIFANLHRAHGVDFRFGSGVSELIGEVGSLSGVGIVPNVELAARAGLEVDNGIVTDAALRTSAPDVYACGDVASSFNPLLGKRIRVEHWANALNGGPAAAKSMLGQEVAYDRVPYFFSDQYDLGMEYSGYAEP